MKAIKLFGSQGCHLRIVHNMAIWASGYETITLEIRPNCQNSTCFYMFFFLHANADRQVRTGSMKLFYRQTADERLKSERSPPACANVI